MIDGLIAFDSLCFQIAVFLLIDFVLACDGLTWLCERTSRVVCKSSIWQSGKRSVWHVLVFRLVLIVYSFGCRLLLKSGCLN